MPFDWRRLIPYGLGALIPRPPPVAPGAPAPLPPAPSTPPPVQLAPAPADYAPPTYTPPQTNYAPPTYGDSPTINPFGSRPFGQGPDSIWGSGTTSSPSQGGVFGTIGSAFAPGGIFGDAPGMGRINTGAAGGQFAGVAPWSAQGVAAQAAAQNPGSTGTASVDLGPAGTVAMRGGHAI